MKVALSEQIHEAEVHRDAIATAAAARPELVPRLDRSEGIVLTLRLLATVEPEFRQFMQGRQHLPQSNEGRKE